MTVKVLKSILRKLPPSMEVVVLSGGEDLSAACKENSEIVEAEVDGKKEDVFLIVPCNCGEEIYFNLN